MKNLSIPQRLIRTLIIKLFQAKILTGGQLIKSEKLGQGTRAAKTEAINSLYNNEKTKQKLIKTKYAESRSKSSEERLMPIYELDKMTKLANELHKPFRKPPQYSKVSFCSKDNIWNADLIIVSKPEKWLQVYFNYNGWFTLDTHGLFH